MNVLRSWILWEYGKYGTHDKNVLYTRRICFSSLKRRRQWVRTEIITANASSSWLTITRVAKSSKQMKRCSLIVSECIEANTDSNWRQVLLIWVVRLRLIKSTSNSGWIMISVWIETLLRRARFVGGWELAVWRVCCDVITRTGFVEADRMEYKHSNRIWIG